MVNRLIEWFRNRQQENAMGRVHSDPSYRKLETQLVDLQSQVEMLERELNHQEAYYEGKLVDAERNAENYAEFSYNRGYSEAMRECGR